MDDEDEDDMSDLDDLDPALLGLPSEDEDEEDSDAEFVFSLSFSCQHFMSPVASTAVSKKYGRMRRRH